MTWSGCNAPLVHFTRRASQNALNTLAETLVA
jgi:hypothetical protein